MPLSVTCSSCGAKLRAPDSTLGLTFKCPKCGSQISVAEVTAFHAEQPRSLQTSETADDVSIKRQSEPLDEAIAASKLPLGFGIGSLALSVIGMVFSLIPCVGAWFAIPLCGLGLLLGIVGAVFALIRQGRGIGFPLAGSITGFAGIGIAIMWLTVCSGIFNSATRSAQDAAKQVGPAKSVAQPQPHNLAASVTWTNPGTRQIGLQHDGIPGSIIAGNNRFSLAPEAPWPDILVGQKVECVMEWRNGQWFVSQLTFPKAQAREQPRAPKLWRDVPKMMDIQQGEVKEKEKADARQVRYFTGHKSLVNCVALSADGRFAASGSGFISRHSDNSVRVWDTETGKELCCLEGHTAPVLCVAFSPDGSKVVSGSKDKTISLWSVATKKEFRRLDGHTSAVIAVAFSSDGKRILSCGGYGLGSPDNTIRVWDAESGKELAKFDLSEKGHTFFIASIAFSADGDLALVQPHGTNNLAKSIMVCDLTNGKTLRGLEGHTDVIGCIALSKDGSKAISTGYDLSIRCWDTKTGRELRPFQGPRQLAVCIAFSSDGKRAISDHKDGTIYLWDTATGKELLRMPNKHGHYVDARHNIVFSPDGKYALSASHNDVLLWDLTDQ